MGENNDYKKISAFESVGNAIVDGGAGLAGGILLVIVGLVLCCFGILMLVGIPLIILGIALPFIYAFKGATKVKGACPYCKTQNLVSRYELGYNCIACKKRFVIQNGQFKKVE